MKGVEAVIAVILILMITVALAALAYVWFTSIFQQLTTGAGQSITGTTNTIATNFGIEAAKFNVSNSNKISVTIRNTGSIDIDASKIAVYVNDVLKDDNAAGTLKSNDVLSFVVSESGGGGFASSQCNNILKVSMQGGVSQTTTISC